MNTNRKLREYALEFGTDVDSWPEACQRTAIVEWFDKDEEQQYPDWIGDCLSEGITMIDEQRAEIIAALRLEDTQHRLLKLGEVLERALMSYPIDTMTKVCEENIYDWRAQEQGVWEACA